MRMVLTECEESKDDGVGDEVDGVAGAGEVKLPASDALVHGPHLLCSLDGEIQINQRRLATKCFKSANIMKGYKIFKIAF